MEKICLCVLSIFVFLIIPGSISVEDNVKNALLQFMEKISAGNLPDIPNWGWNNVSDPCIDKWFGVFCDSSSQNIKKITLGGLNFTGTFDAGSLCVAKSLGYLSLENNYMIGPLPEEIGKCKHLTHLYFSRNRFSGNVPDSMSQLNNLKRLDISNNEFSGDLPNLSRISGLISFLAQNNRLSGAIPGFHFTNLDEFNVSNNRFSGPIPDVKEKFGVNSFSGNPDLCGRPLSNPCPLTPPPASPKRNEKHESKNRFLIYSGYIVLSLVVVLLITLRLVVKKKPKEKNAGDAKKGRGTNTSTELSSTSDDTKTGQNRSEYSITSAQSSKASSALVVLRGPLVNGLKFEELLKAPAELLGRSKFGSMYKVMFSEGVLLAVKRMKDWSISSEEFKSIMQRIDQIQHPRVLPPIAFYCSNQEKLLVYDYQPNGSLFKFLHGSRSGEEFDWGSRLQAAATVAEALAFMHRELNEDGIAHGNLKSTNILFNKNMEACISEYGLMVAENQDLSFLAQTTSFITNALKGNRTCSTFKVDVCAFGVILLELLTGKLVQNNGFDLAGWVHSVIREEWTVEVFDQALISEGVSEERMVNLLQVALKCINPSPSERPNMNQVAVMINAIKEEDEKSISTET